MASALGAVFCCPACGAELNEPPGRCEACDCSFPAVSGIPCLFVDAAEKQQKWRFEATVYQRLTAAGVDALETQAREPAQLPSTRARLGRLARATRDNAETVLELLESAGLAPDRAAPGGGGADALALLEYQDHILRDWATGLADDENRAALELVVEARNGDGNWGTTLVLGAGAGRLAYDIASEPDEPVTIALDISPLPFLAAKRLCEGGSLRWTEVPQVPANADSVSVERSLKAPRGVPRALFFVLADAFQPPLSKGAFDTIVTPWFIDIVPRDARETIGLVHGLLRPGGRWLNYGPLSYPKEHPAAWRYTAEELSELCTRAGFDLVYSKTARAPLLSSPASARKRSEQVLALGLTKRASEPSSSDASPPAWLLLSHLPIPRFWPAEFTTPREPPLAYLMRQIDGQRSLSDIANRLIREGAARPEAALNGTRALLTLLYERVRSS